MPCRSSANRCAKPLATAIAPTSPRCCRTIFLRNDDEVLTFIDRRDGWLAEITKAGQSNSRPVAAAAMTDEETAAANRVIEAKLARRVAELKQQIEKAEKKGGDKEVRRLESKLAKTQEDAEDQRAEVARQAKKQREKAGEHAKNDSSEPLNYKKVRLAAADEGLLISEAYLPP